MPSRHATTGRPACCATRPASARAAATSSDRRPSGGTKAATTASTSGDPTASVSGRHELPGPGGDGHGRRAVRHARGRCPGRRRRRGRRAPRCSRRSRPAARAAAAARRGARRRRAAPAPCPTLMHRSAGASRRTPRRAPGSHRTACPGGTPNAEVPDRRPRSACCARETAGDARRTCAGCRCSPGRARRRRSRVLLPVLHAVVARDVGAVARGDERRERRAPAARRSRAPTPRPRRTGRRVPRCPAAGSVRCRPTLSRTSGSVLTTPQELGPTTRMPFARATRTRARCRSRPSVPGLGEAAADDDEPADAGGRRTGGRRRAPTPPGRR